MDPPLQALLAASASFLFISLLFTLLFLLCGRAPKPAPHHHHLPRSLPPPPHPLPSTSTLAFPEESASFDPSLPLLSMSLLAASTSNFSPERIIGDGGFGFVYRALLPPAGLPVAVKRLAPDASNGLREFRAEVDTLGRLRHPNLARILGYCAAGPDRLLVYELLEHGSLDAWLHEPSSPERPPLSWPTRFRVVRDVAAGLAFLHGGCTPSIIHRDIKASNVLLDGDFGARITDFGLARSVEPPRSHVSTQVAGTMGYMPPEYREGATAATAMADVYSFGVLMVEVAAGRRPNWPVKVEEGREVGMVRWARGLAEAGSWMEVLDQAMEREGVAEEEVRGYLDVACRCTSEKARERPPMAEVVALLIQL